MEARQKQRPKLREDLTLYPGPADKNGAPTWTLHDPARNQYFQIDWVAFEIISRLDLEDGEAICDLISQQTTLLVSLDDVEATLKFLSDNELVYQHSPQDASLLYRKNQSRNKNWFDSLLHGYLFFRVPILRPDRLLDKLMPKLGFLFSKRFFQLTLLIFVLGLWGVFRQWDAFSTTLVDTFSIEGILGYAGAIAVVKLLHEMGHAIVAKKCGCRVPTMGLAFLVMWPVAYTDVTESWKLDSHKKRLMIASAGIATELIIAAWSIFMWSVLPEGAFKSLFFFLGTTSIAGTLAINASPFMRFDGYFLLCDIVGMPNLHSRSSAYARWWTREQLFGLNDDSPEPLNETQRKFFLIFAYATWIYRLVVFFGIAVLVYHYFFKALGIAMFLVEIWFFITKPIYQELQYWRKRWKEIGPVVRHKPAYYITLVVCVILLIPFDLTVNTQGVLRPQKSLNVLATRAAQVTKLPPEIGSQVVEGEQLIGLSVPELEKKIRQLQTKVDVLNRQFGSSGFDLKTVNQQPIFKEQLISAKNELDGLLKEYEKLNRRAPFSGVIADIDPDLFLGEWVPKSFSLVTLITEKDWIVDCYVEEDDLRRLDTGNWGRFIPDAPGVRGVGLSIISIDKDATRVLAEGSLSSLAGGEILVRQQNNKLIPERAIYRVRLKVDGHPDKLSTGYIRGRVVILAWPKSILGDAIRNGLAVFIREAGF
ncbi:HlyD family efflux transporter periplasmic adaptor subunit [Polynucleobacter sp. AP-Capit-er-40B-B4]|uniref:site-2 protease family protein n=1 Tax=Polynucleobacter sp. AP-Capit-er-40B-B4 TaxID=2576927 RepID=UPI001C0CB989|nr:site-2 protease family protein [Polynucleobacter sp. AP-Capit-er-40B-B4]MBU3581996.1 HlyD family efflux transporter periplasmic adaptor subunit [Polynucleobacter sp. AP-Capit-er-40B-B4]